MRRPGEDLSPTFFPGGSGDFGTVWRGVIFLKNSVTLGKYLAEFGEGVLAKDAGMYVPSDGATEGDQRAETTIRKTTPEHQVRAAPDGCGEAEDIKLFIWLPPDAADAVLLELVHCRLVAPKDAAPLLDGPVAMFTSPRETPCHVVIREEWFSAGDTRPEASVSKRIANSLRAHGRVVFLLPQLSDLRGTETAVFVVCNKAFEGGLLTVTENLRSARAFLRAGGPGSLKAVEDVSDSRLRTANFLRDAPVTVSLFAEVDDHSTLGGG